MAIDIRIDNGDARVAIQQIFASHEGGVLEGEYLFAMPSRATVSDFAVWDGVTRIPGVILERRRAEEIYENLRQQHIDPGLLQQGERGTEGASEAARTSAFSARIVPIAGWGTKRLEINGPNTSAVLDRLRHRPGVREATIFGQAIHALVDEPYSIEKLGLSRYQVHEADPSLEDVFVTLARAQGE